ncbi:hypothetical protein SAMN02927921_00481 [Sinomicrobium oceani]|uniref:DUF7793 domain-containing protein n=1 Tax=Sinomicrobium oceani TaxID=1150368 RepID=A0A1K1M8U0_9FLAO|nr:hypothetical protein [Sinomicrobium oceani]SFW19556.1 hypothetical protein SAMN02927921_00481 [Sinomicrobium oceani]
MYVSENHIENEYVCYRISGGILFHIYKPDTVIDLRAARIITADRIAFQHHHTYPVLCDVRGITDTDKPGRDYIARNGFVLTRAVSFLADIPVSMGLMQYFIDIHKPRPDIPIRLFTEESAAMEFLEPYTL